MYFIIFNVFSLMLIFPPGGNNIACVIIIVIDCLTSFKMQRADSRKCNTPTSQSHHSMVKRQDGKAGGKLKYFRIFSVILNEFLKFRDYNSVISPFCREREGERAMYQTMEKVEYPEICIINFAVSNYSLLFFVKTC